MDHPPPATISIDEIVKCIRESRDASAWEKSLETYGKNALNNPNIIEALHTRASQIATIDPEGSSSILRWLNDAQGIIDPSGIISLLLQASSDGEINEALEKHRHLITHGFGMNALNEVGHLAQGPVAVSKSILPELAKPILRRIKLIAEFLKDDLLDAECHVTQSLICGVLGDLDGAIEELSTARPIFERLGDQIGLARCIGQIGTYQLQLGHAAQAEQSLDASLKLIEHAPEPNKLLAPTYEELGLLAAKREDWRASADHYRRAAELRLRQGEADKAAFDFENSAVYHILLGEYKTAYAAAQNAVLHCEARPESVPAEVQRQFAEIIAGHAFAVAAQALLTRNPYPLSVPGISSPTTGSNASTPDGSEAEQWVAIAKRAAVLTSSADLEANLELAAANVGLAKKSNLPQAYDDASAALSYFKSHAETNSRVPEALNVLIQVEQLRGHHVEALTKIDAALTMLVADAKSEAVLHFTARKVESLIALGRLREADDLVLANLERAKAVDDPQHRYYVGAFTSALAAMYSAVSQFEAAVPMHIEALRSARELRSRLLEAQEFYALGTLCGRLTENAAHDLPVHSRNKLLRQISEACFPGWWAQQNQPESSEISRRAADLGIRLLRAAVETFSALGQTALEASARGNLANFKRADPRASIQDLLSVLGDVRKARGGSRSEAIVLANMGKRYAELDQVQSAQACFERSLVLSDQCSDFEWSYDTALDLSTIFERQGMFADSMKSLRRAVDYNELARRALPLEDAPRTAFARGRSAAYARMANYYLARNRIADAFEAVQRAKSRTLAEMGGLGDLRWRSPQTAESSMLLEREGALLDELRPYARGDDDAASSLARRPRTEAYAELQEIYRRLAEIDPDYVSLRSGQPLTLQRLTSVLRSQNRETVIVEYFLQSDRLLIFVLRSDWDFPRCIQRFIDGAAIVAWHDDIERQIVLFKSEGPQTWVQLGSILVEPISDFLKDDDLVYLVPHDILHGLPIHALPIAGAPFCLSYSVAYLPAASMLPLCQARARTAHQLNNVCAVGVDFVEEAQDVAKLFPNSELIIGDVEVKKLAEAFAACDVAHISSHGHYDPIEPAKSGMVIHRGGDGGASKHAVLTPADISQMRLPGKLICLSACQSGLSRLTQGDEQLGIVRACFVAGASSVISTLWPVDAEATRRFMLAFYKFLLEKFESTHKIDKAGALRHAQGDLSAAYDDKTYYWGAFVLSGDWR